MDMTVMQLPQANVAATEGNRAKRQSSIEGKANAMQQDARQTQLLEACAATGVQQWHRCGSIIGIQRSSLASTA